MTTTTFTVPMKPAGKARARAGKNGKHYTPAKTVAAEAAIAAAGHSIFVASDRKYTGPVVLDVLAITKPAPSWSKKKALAHQGKPNLQKPDFDNIGKLVADALNGIAYKDDSQIFDGRCRTIWGHEDKLVITVEHIDIEEIE